MIKTKSIIVIIVLLLLGISFVYSKKNASGVPSETPNVAPSTTNSDANPASTPLRPSASGGTVRDMWATWTGYLEAAKSHDVVALKEYAYALSDACKDPKQQKVCFDKMDALYSVGSKFQKSDFTLALEDSKQGILETSLVAISSDKNFGYRRSSMIFVKDSSGNSKLLSLKPGEEWKVKRNPASTTAELQASLEAMVKDTDQDGLTDQIEKCIFPDNYAVITCKESDPSKRDSDLDGYWDGVGFLIPKK